MKQTSKSIILTAVLSLGLHACGQSGTELLGDVRLMVVNSLGEDLSLVHHDGSVTTSAVSVGSAPNQVLFRGQEAVVISSTTNSVQVIDVAEWTVVREYSVGDGCNPYLGALSDSGHLLLSCFASNELLKVDLDADMADDPVLDRLSMPAGADLKPFDANVTGYARPQGVAVHANKAYVTLSNLDDSWMSAGPGLVVVVDVAAWTKDKIIELSKTNPASVHALPANGDKLYVPCSGNYDGSGVVDIIDTATDTIVDTIEIGGAPGRMNLCSDGTVLVGDQLDGRVMRFAAENGQVLDPIMLCPADYENSVYDFIADVAGDQQGHAYAACFATDTVHRFACDGQESLESYVVGDGPQALLLP